MKLTWCVAVASTVLLLAGCGSQPAAAPVASVVTRSVTAAAPTAASSTAAVVNPADASTCNAVRNAWAAAQFPETAAAIQSLPAADYNPRVYFKPVQEYVAAGITSGSTSAPIAAVVTALNVVMTLMGTYDNVTDVNVKAMFAKYTAVQVACTAVNAWS